MLELLKLGAGFEAVVAVEEADKKALKKVFRKNWEICIKAWKAIKRFDARCWRSNNLFEFGRFQKQMLMWANHRHKTLLGAAETVQHPKLRAHFGIVAAKTNPNDLAKVLNELQEKCRSGVHESISQRPQNQQGKPAGWWQVMMFRMRRFFYDDRWDAKADNLKEGWPNDGWPNAWPNPHLHGISKMFQIFNTVSYLELVAGYTRSRALDVAGRLHGQGSHQSFREYRAEARKDLERFNDAYNKLRTPTTKAARGASRKRGIKSNKTPKRGRPPKILTRVPVEFRS